MIDTVKNLFEKYNLWQVVRYGCVGVFVASAHALTAFTAYHYLGIDPTLSNFAGFLVGAVLSYLGSYYFTFRLSEGHKRSLPRFALVWIIGIAINVGLFKVLLTQFDVPFMINVFVAIVLTPIAQFLMLKFWAFKH
ncbi:MAG: GtrA family protein [Hyphomonadaceae bacterium]|nr:GtrA family protein [Hyphomonadaceae bacterium]